MTKKRAKAAKVDPRQVSFVVAKSDVLALLDEEQALVLEHLIRADRAGDRARVGELREAIGAIASIRGRVKQLGLG